MPKWTVTTRVTRRDGEVAEDVAHVTCDTFSDVSDELPETFGPPSEWTEESEVIGLVFRVQRC